MNGQCVVGDVRIIEDRIQYAAIGRCREIANLSRVLCMSAARD